MSETKAEDGGVTGVGDTGGSVSGANASLANGEARPTDSAKVDASGGNASEGNAAWGDTFPTTPITTGGPFGTFSDWTGGSAVFGPVPANDAATNEVATNEVAVNDAGTTGGAPTASTPALALSAKTVEAAPEDAPSNEANAPVTPAPAEPSPIEPTAVAQRPAKPRRGPRSEPSSRRARRIAMVQDASRAATPGTVAVATTPTSTIATPPSAAPPPAVPQRRSRSAWLAAALTIGLVGWMASGMLGEEAAAPAPPPRAVEDAPVSVEVLASSARPVERALTIEGEVEPGLATPVRAEAGGVIERLEARKGEMIEAGEVIARIAPAERRAQVVQARDSVAAARAEFERIESLVDRGFSTRSALEQARTALSSAESQLASAEAGFENLTIVAPAAGALNALDIDAGEVVQPGDQVATIVDTRDLVIEVSVPQRSITDVEPGMAAEVAFVTGQRATGRVTFVAANADGATRTFPVEIAVANPDRAIPSGVSAEVRLPIEEIEAHFVSPAILSLGENGALGVKAVQRAGTDGLGTVGFYPVELVRAETAGIWVSGLPEEATIVTVGQGFVREGETVRAVAAGTVADAPPLADDRAPSVAEGEGVAEPTIEVELTTVPLDAPVRVEDAPSGDARSEDTVAVESATVESTVESTAVERVAVQTVPDAATVAADEVTVDGATPVETAAAEVARVENVPVENVPVENVPVKNVPVGTVPLDAPVEADAAPETDTSALPEAEPAEFVEVPVADAAADDRLGAGPATTETIPTVDASNSSETVADEPAVEVASVPVASVPAAGDPQREPPVDPELPTADAPAPIPLDPTAIITAAQERLAALGYDVGPATGAQNPRTRVAVGRYQSDEGLPVSGDLDPRTLERLGVGTASAPAPQTAEAGDATDVSDATAAPLPVDAIQAALNALGYDAGPVDGLLGPGTRAAIRAFQAANGLPETGEPSPELSAALDAATAGN